MTGLVRASGGRRGAAAARARRTSPPRTPPPPATLGAGQLVELGGWRLWNDRAATEEVYARIVVGGCERCGCDACLNFSEARHLCFGTDWIDLLEWLGIDPLLESEVIYRRPGHRGRHVYSGWFHLVGEIEAGPRRNVGRLGSIESRYLVSVGAGLSLAFSSDRRLAPAVFDGLPVVELEFALEAPWVCDLPEPD